MNGLLCSEETELDQDAVLNQLERILADRRFVSADRNANFLRYVVMRTLDGKAEEIKEIVIATELYGRSSSYDPKIDSIVRVEATRLRTKLRDYYEQEGRLDPIGITIPKGAYVPQFKKIVAENITPQKDAVPLVEVDVAATPASRKPWLPWVALPLLLIFAGSCLLLRDRKPSQPHPEALLAWQEGNELLRQDPHNATAERGAPPILLRAIERFEFAVAKDPLFAPAWASLAEAYNYSFPYVGRDPAEDARRSEAAARRAIELDGKLAAGHAMLALDLFCLRWNFKDAESAYRRAIALDPRSAYAVVEYADLLRETGRIEEAVNEIRKARALMPAIPVLATKEAEIHLDQNHPDAAIAAATEAIRLNRHHYRAYVPLGAAWEAKGEFEKAIDAYRQALHLNNLDRRALPAYGYLLGVTGRRDEAMSVVRQLEDMNARIRNCAFQIAIVYAGLGEHKRALDWLERAWQTHQELFPFATLEYRLKPLHKYPRFHQLLSHAGLKVVSN